MPTTIRTFPIRCPCGETQYVYEDVGSVQCPRCRRIIQWSRDAALVHATHVDVGTPSPVSLSDIWSVVGDIYKVGYWLCFVLVFLGCWIYTIANSGFIVGVLIGWAPSVIVAGLVSFLWPLVLAAVIWLLHYL